MADHTEFLELAIELIEEEGREVTFGTLAGSTPDSDRPWKGGAASPALAAQTFTQYAVFLPDGTEGVLGGGGFGKSFMVDDLLKNAEQILLTYPAQGAGAEDFGKVTTVVDDDGLRWTITGMKELKPANLTVLYAMGVKR